MSLSKNARLPPNLMDMPDLVMRKILKDVDLISMLNLRKVCEAFQDYIDDNYMGFDVDWIEIRVLNNGSIWLDLMISGSKKFRIIQKKTLWRLKFQKKGDEECTVLSSIFKKSVRMRNSNVDEFVVVLDGILQNLKAPLKSLSLLSESDIIEKEEVSKFQSILRCCSSRKMKTLVFGFELTRKIHESIIEKLGEVMKSWRRPVKVENLKIEISEPENLSKIVPNFDKKTVERLRIYRKSRQGAKKEHVDLDKILDFRSFTNLKQLYAPSMIMTSSYQSMAHIPKCEVCFPLSLKEKKELEKEFPNFIFDEDEEDKNFSWTYFVNWIKSAFP